MSWSCITYFSHNVPGLFWYRVAPVSIINSDNELDGMERRWEEYARRTDCSLRACCRMWWASKLSLVRISQHVPSHLVASRQMVAVLDCHPPFVFRFVFCFPYQGPNIDSHWISVRIDERFANITNSSFGFTWLFNFKRLRQWTSPLVICFSFLCSSRYSDWPQHRAVHVFWISYFCFCYATYSTCFTMLCVIN